MSQFLGKNESALQLLAGFDRGLCLEVHAAGTDVAGFGKVRSPGAG
jgi:hypothetical protein